MVGDRANARAKTDREEREKEEPPSAFPHVVPDFSILTHRSLREPTLSATRPAWYLSPLAFW
jgi:hypothetical protein